MNFFPHLYHHSNASLPSLLLHCVSKCSFLSLCHKVVHIGLGWQIAHATRLHWIRLRFVLELILGQSQIEAALVLVSQIS